MAVIDGAKVFIRHKKTKKYLFVLRDDKPNIPNPNEWSLIGGGIEDGETPREAAHREILEELNILVDNLQLVVEEPVKIISEGIEYEVTGHIFLAETDKYIKDMILSEGQELRYLTLDEVEKLERLTSNLKRRIRIYREILESK